MPAAFATLLYERCGLSQQATWDTWQAMAASVWTSVQQVRAQFLLFATCPDTADALARHHLEPATLIAVLESLRQEHLLTAAEATIVEEAILRQTTKTGTWKQWKEPSYV
jgi:hypothetical protein